MYIVHHAHLATLRDEGETQFAAADASLGLKAFEVWMRRLEPGAQTHEMRHDGELVVLVLAGCGKLLIDGGPQRFNAPCTVIVPPRRGFRFVNHGCEPMQMVAVYTRRPTPVDGAGDGSRAAPAAGTSWPADPHEAGSIGR